MSLGVGTQLLGNIVKLMRHKVKGEIICILALLTIPKKIQIMRESSQKNFTQRNTARSNKVITTFGRERPEND